MLKNLLSHPSVYQAFQQVGGFFGARVMAINEFLDIPAGAKIIDIGCGPGYIVDYLPSDVRYIGYDIDQNYIDHANKQFSARADFHCKYFDAKASRENMPVDIVMMNGVMHHIPDAELKTTLRNVYDVLSPGGLLFTLDGCYRPGQSRFRKWMLDNDRGEFVRDEAGYRNILAGIFDEVTINIRENYSRTPYTYAICVAKKSRDTGAPS